jgi:hypothetical protein
MLRLRFIQLERLSEAVQHLRRDAGKIAALHPGVVLHADAGEHGDFLTP